MSAHLNNPSKKLTFHEELAIQRLQAAGDGLCAAGFGLRTIGLMLSERDLSKDEFNGLCHAITALGDLVKINGNKVYSHAVRQLPGGEE